jgi:hypothetical protein
MMVASASRSTFQSTRKYFGGLGLAAQVHRADAAQLCLLQGRQGVTYPLRCEDLFGTGKVCQACRAVDGVAETVAVDFNDFAAFHTHLHLHGCAMTAGDTRAFPADASG